MSVEVKIKKVRKPIQLDKRQNAPFVLYSSCPKCGQQVRKDLTDSYLSYPKTDTITNASFYHELCETSWTEKVVVRLVVEAA